MNKTRFIIGVLFMFTSSIVSSQQELDSYLQIAAENNPGLRAKFNKYLASLEVAPRVKALPDPQIAFAYFIKPVETRVGPQQVKISASQMLPWFGTLASRENIAIQSAKANYEVFLEAKSKLFNDVRSTYSNIYYNQKAIAIIEENLRFLESIQKLAEIKVEAGISSTLDVYRIEMETNDLENQFSLLKDNHEVLEVLFFNLLNIKREGGLRIPALVLADSITQSKMELEALISKNNHHVLQLSLERQALQHREDLAKNLGRPSFTIGIDYTVVGEGNNNLAGTDAIMLPKIGLTIPLFRNKYRAMVNEVLYLQKANDDEISDKENVLNSIFENTWRDYQDANRRIDLFDSQMDLARLSVKLLEVEYSTGGKNFEEMLRMERKVLMYSLELEKAKADSFASFSFINYLMGQ